jgi:hypothetical protein
MEDSNAHTDVCITDRRRSYSAESIKTAVRKVLKEKRSIYNTAEQFSGLWSPRCFSKTSVNRPKQSTDFTRLPDITPPQNYKPGTKKEDRKLQVGGPEQMKLSTTGYTSKAMSSGSLSPCPRTSDWQS